MSLVSTYAILGVGILLEVMGTSALIACDQFRRPLASALVVVGYVGAAVLVSFTLRTLPMGIVYALWSGIGMVMIVVISWLGFGQRIDLPGLAGVSLIVAGVVVLNLFSTSVGHGG